jgi:hypothetical protein
MLWDKANVAKNWLQNSNESKDISKSGNIIQ